MTEHSILIAGCGDVGTRLGRKLAAAGHTVFGLRRTINQLPECIQGIAADLTDPHSLRELPACDILVYSATASQMDEAGYRAAYIEGVRNILDALPTSPKHIFFTSSTAVYAQESGEWVDETSPCEPRRYNGKVMLEAEQQVLNSGVPATVTRFSGIYGPRRRFMLGKIEQGIGFPAEPLKYGNRIHSEDAAGALAHLAEKVFAGESIEPVYIVSDDDPAPLHEVSNWLAGELGIELTEFQAGKRGGSKRCSNALLKASGYQLEYPGFKEGYRALLDR